MPDDGIPESSPAAAESPSQNSDSSHLGRILIDLPSHLFNGLISRIDGEDEFDFSYLQHEPRLDRRSSGTEGRTVSAGLSLDIMSRGEGDDEDEHVMVHGTDLLWAPTVETISQEPPYDAYPYNCFGDGFPGSPQYAQPAGSNALSVCPFTTTATQAIIGPPPPTEAADHPPDGELPSSSTVLPSKVFHTDDESTSSPRVEDISSATIRDENVGSLTPAKKPPNIKISPPRTATEAASGSNKRKRGKFREKERTKVSRVRARGACARCRVYHLSCDLNFPCSNCVRVAESVTAFTQPCYHEPLDNVIGFRMGNSRANQPQSQLPLVRWAVDDQTTRRIQIEFPFLGIPSGSRPRMPVDCRKFVPRDSDILEDVWEGSDGDKLVLTFPPFACEEPEDLRASLESYIDKCSALLEHDLGMETTDVISAATFAEAQRYAQANPDSAVVNALRIRLIAYFSRESMAIVGHESLGIPVVDDQRFPIYGQVPVPSVLDFQIDTTAIHIMTKLMEGVTKRLKQVIFGRKNKQRWYEVYLTCFILLESLEKVYSLQVYYSGINEHMGGNTFANVSYTSRTMMDKWRYSADNLLYHYRCILRAMDPFSFAWDALELVDDLAKANLDPEAVLYMQKMCKHLKEEHQFVVRNRGNIGHPFSWRCELFLPDKQ